VSRCGDSNRITKWNERYRASHDDLPIPLPFFVECVSSLKPGKALDIACGTGRHAIWLAEHGWQVTAIDGSDVAIELLRARGLEIETRVEDIEAQDFRLPGEDYELIVDTFFLHRPLFLQIKAKLRPGGVVVLAFHLSGSFAIQAAELEEQFAGWEKVFSFVHTQIPAIELCLRKPGS
jgi:tellurite methyltransferase